MAICFSPCHAVIDADDNIFAISIFRRLIFRYALRRCRYVYARGEMALRYFSAFERPPARLPILLLRRC